MMQVTSANMLANILRDQRKSKKLSQSDAAKAVGIKQTTISSFENSPDGTKLTTLFKLLATLDLELTINQRTGTELTPKQTAEQQWQEEW